MRSGPTESDCGCGPTPSELRDLRRGVTRRAVVAAGALGALIAGFASGPGDPAFAAKYPTWDDVEKARRNEASKNSEIARIETLIRSLQSDVEAKQAEAERLGQEHVLAVEAYEDAVDRAETLQAQADAESARAEAAAQKLGILITEQYRSGKRDPALELFFSGEPGSADDLLSRLGTMDRLVEANREVYADATGARDNAQSLSAQAEVARAERDRRKNDAEKKMQAAQNAAQAALGALETQSEHRDVLEAQLAALRDATATTVADYQTGVEVRRRERAERIRRERAAAAARAREEERRRQEEEREQAANAGGGGTGGNTSGGGAASGGGQVQPSGWVRPAHGGVTSYFGSRGTICSNGYCTASGHRGLDFAASCGAPIYAAASGTVTFAGWSGSWGNYIKILHSDGSTTAYAHILNGGYNVRYGQRVRAGQLIAYAGTTGASTGCHLHFEVYRDGVRVDPAAHLRNRGVRV